MALTKYQFARYRIIHECLKNDLHIPSTSLNPEDRGIWPIADLSEKITEKLDLEKPVSDRQLAEDISRMKDNPDLAYYAPIGNKRSVGYYYSNRDYELNDRPLRPAEVTALKEVIELLKQFKGFKYFEDAEGLVYNIEEKILHSEFTDVQFDVLPDYRGLEFIDSIKKAIRNQRVLKMTYKAFYEEAEIPRHIHPYLLKEYNNRWFVYAYTNEYKEEGVYGLDRIIKLEQTDKHYKKADKKKIINYFKDIIGVTNYQERAVEEIVLRVKKPRANYLRTKPIHRSQKLIKESLEYDWFSFRLKPNRELTALILGFGEDMIVEKPLSLVKEVGAILQEAADHYNQ